MQVRKIDAENKRDVCRFVEFPFLLYRFCAQWVPPLVSSIKTDMDRRKHPFYRHSSADFFLAESDGQTVGRIAVMYNRNYNDYQKDNIAFFGYFESVQDTNVAQALFEAAQEWARAQGASEIVGPKGLIGSDGGGILVEGFEYRPVMGTSYNLPYYDELIKAAGFEKDRDFYSARFDSKLDLPKRFYQVAERVREQRGLRIVNFRSRRELRPWITPAVKAHGRAFSRNYTYYPPTQEEITSIINSFYLIADPRLIKLVTKDGEIIGVVLGLPDLAAALQRARGRLFPFGWFYILAEQRRAKRALLPALGLLPAYQGLGGNALLYTELAKTLAESSYRSVEFVSIDEKNAKSLREINAFNVNWYKTLRLYRKAV